jgi:hypothetical protein
MSARDGRVFKLPQVQRSALSVQKCSEVFRLIEACHTNQVTCLLRVSFLPSPPLLEAMDILAILNKCSHSS